MSLSMPYWYVAVPRQGGHLAAPQPRTVHAKRMGALATACGLSTEFWSKDLSWEFAPADAGACPECVQAITEAYPNRWEYP